MHPRRTNLRSFAVLGLALTALATGSAASAQPAETQPASASSSSSPNLIDSISIDEIERGQVGYGVSVFAGSELERFDVEVVGVLRDLNPGVSFIVARLEGQGLEKSGVVGGMSGSPVYIDDRLAGAVAFSWSFASDAIAGITPIGAMRELASLPQGMATMRAESELGDAAALVRLLDRPPRRELLAEHLAALRPARGLSQRSGAQLSIGGFDGRARDLLTSSLLELAPVAPAGRVAGDGSALPPLAPGSAVAGLLVGGDLEMAVTGTVTELDGDQVLAFGHPFLATGPMRIPMAKAEVVTVVPSRMSSFKLTNVGPVIGAFDQDRLAGMRGRIGLEAPTTPVEIRMRGTIERDYHLEVADIPAMRPSLIAVSALQVLEAAARSAGEQGVDLEMRFEISGYETLDLRQTFDGSQAGIDAAIYLLQLVAFLELNTWVDIDLTSVELEITHSERPRAATLVGVHASRLEVRPGDQVELRLDLRDFRGERFQRSQTLAIPKHTPVGPYYLFVGDGMSADAARLQIEPSAPQDFAQSLELLASYHSRDQLVILGASGPTQGLVVAGRSLPNLPSSMRSLYRSVDRRAKSLALEIEQQVVVPLDRPIEGLERLDLRILEPLPEVAR